MAVARRNVARHRLDARVRVVHADLMVPCDAAEAAAGNLPERADVVVSNPPYVARDARLPKTVADYEPHAALFAGAEGLDVLRPLVAAAAARLGERGLLALEYAPEQTQALVRTMAPHFAGVHVLHDLAGHERVAVGWRGEGSAADFALGFGAAAPRGPAAPDVQLDDPEQARD